MLKLAEFFESALYLLLLLGVSGIGAATCRVILSSMTVAELAGIISEGNDKVLKSVKGEDIPKNIITPFIVFHSDGTYNGNLGCNKFFGSYRSGKASIKMEYGGATKRLCETMKVEKMFMLQLHSDFKQYEIIKDTLVLKDKEGEVLRFFAGVKPE